MFVELSKNRCIARSTETYTTISYTIRLGFYLLSYSKGFDPSRVRLLSHNYNVYYIFMYTSCWKCLNNYMFSK